MSSNLLYYSTNTRLAFYISEMFYKSHFVWCSPVFNPMKLSSYDYRCKIPVSSSPYSLYKRLSEDVNSGDLHSAKIIDNVAGLKRGAIIKYENKLIDEDDLQRINAIVDSAQITEFKPIVYIIPALVVEGRLIKIGVNEAANPLSSEYQIQDLRKNEFEIIEFD